MMTVLWWVLIALCLSFGLLGCFINKVPGPIAVVLATLIAILGLEIDIEWSTFGIIAGMAVASMIASKALVKLMKKIHEYSKRATWGTTIASLIGLSMVAALAAGDASLGVQIAIWIVGLVVLPFVLAFLLELTNRQGAMNALKSAGAATCVYVVDTLFKLAVFVYAIYAIFELEIG